jgi:hypothetical protein
MNMILTGMYRMHNFLLRADTPAAVDESMKTDPIALPFIFLICLALPVFIIGRFDYGKKGRITLGIVFGLIDFFITATAMRAGMEGAGTALSLAAGAASGGLVTFLIAVFGHRMGRWFRRHEAYNGDGLDRNRRARR